MLNAILKGSATLCLLMLAVTLYFVPFWVGAWTAHVDSASAAVNMAARFTITTEADIKKNLAVNLNAITGEQGHLSVLNNTLYQTGASVSRAAQEVEGDAAALVFGVRSYRTGEYRRGLLDVAESVAETSHKLGDTSLAIANLSEGIRIGYFECPGLGCSQSRFLAITGEGMRLMDASRRTMEIIRREAPEFTRNVNGITSDFHALTSNAVKKHWYDRVGTVGAVAKGGFVACKILFGC